MTIRIPTLLSGLALLATAFLPVAEAQSQLNVRSVGEIFVDAAGRASGQNLEALLVEANGILTAYSSKSLDADVFDSVSVEGFVQTEKLKGVGTSELVLRGNNAVLTLTDTIQGTLRIQATADTTAHYRLAKGVTAEVAGSGHRVDLLAADGQHLGSLLVLGATGRASEASHLTLTAAGTIAAKLERGSQALFAARPVYVPSPAWNDAVADATVEGSLIATVTTEFAGSREAKSETNYYGEARGRATTNVDAASSVTTDVRSRAEAAVMVAYDLAWETLPARSASEVAVYADGTLAERVASAEDVYASATAGIPAYYAMASGGRTQVLASTPDFESAASHRLTVTASAQARSETQARSESDSQAASSAYGELVYYANGKLTGEFLSGNVRRENASVHDYTSLETRTEVFESIRVDGDSFGDVSASGPTVTLDGAKADLTLVDDAYATLLVKADQQTSAVFDLGASVKATAASQDVIHLDGPDGYAGVLVLVSAEARASATASTAAASRLVTTGEGHVTALLDAGSRLVYRGESQAHAQADASAELVAQAIARGEVAGHVVAGLEANLIAATDVEYNSDATLETAAEAKGRVDVTLASATSTVFLFESRGAAIAAKSAGDVQVTVDGRAATLVGTAQQALAAGGSARYQVETTLDGTVRMIVNTGSAAAQGAEVAITSRLEGEARAAANTDAFGTFKIFSDGLAQGSFVSLKTDQRAGVVTDFTMLSTGTEVFESIQAGASAFASTGADGASTLLLENRETQVEFSDTTSAYMRVVAKSETDVRYRLAAGMEAALHSASVIEVTSRDGAYLGSMIITDAEGKAAAGSAFAEDAKGQIRAHLAATAQVIFRTHVGIEAELSAQERALMNEAIAAGRVGGQVVVQTQASLSAAASAALAAQGEATAAANGLVASASELEGRVTAAVTTSYYQDVQIVTAALQDRVDLTVSSTLTTGKTLIVSLDRETVSGMLTGDAEILVDGQAAAQADSYADILDPNDDAGVYEYFVLAGDAGTQVLVSIPHFSTHSVTLKNREPASPPVFMYATIFLGVLVAAETVILVRRRMP